MIATVIFVYTLRHVIPAKAGIQPLKALIQNWIPAFAGMTFNE